MNPSDEIDRQFRAFLDASDTDALRRAFDHIAPELLRVGRSVGLDAASAEDALQETLLVVLRRRDAFERGRSLLPWAAGIMRNTARSLLRSQEDERRVTSELRASLGDETMNALEHGAERMQELDRAIESLPTGQRSVVRLRYIDGLRPLEIAERLDLEPNTVSARLSRGLRALRERVPPGLLGVALLASAPRAVRGLEAVWGEVQRRATEVGAARTAGRGLLVAGGLATALGVTLLATSGPFASRTGATPEVADRPPLSLAPDRIVAAAVPAERRASSPPTAGDEVVSALAGRIRDPRGAPVQDVEVFAVAQAFRLLLPDTPPAPVARTDADGAFRASTSDCPTSDFGFYLVLARGPEGAAVAITEPDAPLDLVLEPTVTAEVRVVDESGRPIEGAQVAVVPAIEAFAEQNELGHHSIAGLEVLDHHVLFGAHTDDLGLARVDGLPWDPDAFGVGAVGAVADGTLAGRAPIRWTSLDDVPRVEITLVRIENARVRGRVVDTSGAPIPNARVRAMHLRDGTLDEIASPVAADGAFGLPAAWTRRVPCTLECSAPGYAELRRLVDVDDLRAGAGSLDLTLRRLATVRGRVQDGLGNPVAGAEVVLRTAGSVHVTTTTADGGFVLGGTPSGPSVLTVTAGRDAPEALRRARVSHPLAESPEPLEIVLESGTAAFEVALVAGDASALPSLETTVLVRGGPGGTLRTHRPSAIHRDRLRFRRVPLGPWTVYAVGHTPEGETVTASSRLEVTGAEDVVRLDVPLPGEVEFELVDPVVDGPVHLMGRWGPALPLPPWFGHAKDGGARVVDRVLSGPGPVAPQDLAPGTWSFFGWREDGQVIRAFTREIAPGSREHVDLELVPGGRARFEVPGLTRASVVEVEFLREGESAWMPVARFDVGRNHPTRRTVTVPLGHHRWRATILGNALTGELERTHPTVEGTVTITDGDPAEIDLGRGTLAR